MKILLCGSEAIPFISTGGLGDVIGSLPVALKQVNPDWDIRVVLPLYSQLKDRMVDELTYLTDFPVNLAWRSQYCGIFSYQKDNVTFYFVDNEYYFRRAKVYGEYDDAERFAFFSRAILQMMPHIGFFPDVLHANDWQTALSIIYLKRQYAHLDAYSRIKTIYTIHNIEYQGRYGLEILEDLFGLDPRDASTVLWDGDINLTKGAIALCDRVTTVSRTYAHELCDSYYSGTLSALIRARHDSLWGIVNGIDTVYYDPSKLTPSFSPRRLKGKAEIKKRICERFQLSDSPDTPLLAMVSRLASHKGFDLVSYIFDEMMQRNMNFLLLGTGEEELQRFFLQKQEQYPGRVAVALCFDKELSKEIFAASDLFLMPSRTEPCGLSHMIASRYGSLPIVRQTGGLFDTVAPFQVIETEKKPILEGNGFNFGTYNAHDMLGAIDRALELWQSPTLRRLAVEKVMKTDFSWAVSAQAYTDLYQSI